MVYLRALRGTQVIVSPPSASPSRYRLPAMLLAGLLVATAGAVPPLAAAEPDPAALLDRLDAAWKSHDEAAWLGAWRASNEEQRAEERDYVRERWAGEESRLEIERPLETPRPPFKVPATVISIAEPRGRVEQVVFTLDRGPDGWAVIGRQTVSQIDGLVHLALGPAFRADGLVFHLPDFEMRIRRGTLFLPPPSLGPTVLVFVGEATVRFAPGPPTEQEQLRQFSGRRELVETVHAAFVRIHPADFHRVLTNAALERDPQGEGSRAAALKFFREHVDDTYQLDAPLPRAPWWLVPALGDSVVTFQTRRGALTFTVSQSEPEGLSLFDRARRRQICLYPLPGTQARYDEDDERDVDVLHHDLTVRFEPERFGLVGFDTMRLRLRSPASTIRLRLDEALRVISIRSPEGGEHLFFRVRHQDGMMVSLGSLSGTVGEITLTVRFAGNQQPHPVEREAMPQVAPPVGFDDDISVEEALVYSNRSPWYPQGEADDYATAMLHLDVPAGMMAISGGQQTSLRTEGGRTRVEYRQDLPGKYITVAVGRFYEAGRQVDGDVTVAAWAAPRLRGVADARMAEAAAILRFYESEFGPCPYPSLNLALVESRVPGGHSPPGMIVVSIRPALLRGALRDDPASFPDVPEFFIAHELAHQWWGHGVAGRNYHERWLSEAFAQYAAALWVRHNRGESAFRGMLVRMGRWALHYADKGPIYLGHRLGHIEGDPQVYRAVVYDKGAYVLHMLRQIVGEDAFRRAVMALQSAHRFGKVGTDDVRAALETASGLDLRPYFAEWVYGTSLPELRLASRSTPAAEGYRTEITVHGRDLPGPVPLEVAVAHPAGTEVRTVSLEPEGGSWTVDTPGPPRRVDVNAGRGLLARVRRN
ncbi:MAG: hypothetical protein DMF77_01320 [Acidobacteria bacterium]|nr:MAG: hypothetical protein DMF77_01320 [Acidobacteriota bacterium]